MSSLKIATKSSPPLPLDPWIIRDVPKISVPHPSCDGFGLSWHKQNNVTWFCLNNYNSCSINLRRQWAGTWVTWHYQTVLCAIVSRCHMLRWLTFVTITDARFSVHSMLVLSQITLICRALQGNKHCCSTGHWCNSKYFSNFNGLDSFDDSSHRSIRKIIE